MIKYIHFRFMGADGGPSSKGGITVAYEYMPDNGPTSVVRYAFAICSPKDHYNKKIGRFVSAGRLMKHSHEFHRVEGVNIGAQIIDHHDKLLAEEVPV